MDIFLSKINGNIVISMYYWYCSIPPRKNLARVY